MAEVRAALDAQRAKVLRMKAVRDEGAVLHARRGKRPTRLRRRGAAASTRPSLESQTTQSNVSVLTPAAPPLEPSSPKLLLNIALWPFLGGLLLASARRWCSKCSTGACAPSAKTSAAMGGLAVLGVLPKPERAQAAGAAQRASADASSAWWAACRRPARGA